MLLVSVEIVTVDQNWCVLNYVNTCLFLLLLQENCLIPCSPCAWGDVQLLGNEGCCLPLGTASLQ